MKSVAILSVIASTVYAASPYIPSDISEGCLSFLNGLDADSSLVACTHPLIEATSSLGSSTSAASPAAASSALSTLCSSSASSACSSSAIRSELTSFYAACTAELTSASPNADVQRLYDLLYVLSPLSTSLCAKDNKGSFCATEIPAAATSSSAVSGALAALTTTDSANSQLTIPNVASYEASNLVFLLAQPSLNSTDLCTTCTRDVVSAYTSFMSTVPYAMGIAQSPTMSGFTALYQGVVGTCGSSFLSGVAQAAGGLKETGSTSAAPKLASAHLGAVGASLGAVALAFVALF